MNEGVLAINEGHVIRQIFKNRKIKSENLSSSYNGKLIIIMGQN